jgi:hypothetical protein
MDVNYDEMMQKSIDYYNSKVLNEINKGLTDSGLRLLKLIEIIPNWETYLTPKQLEATECYIKCLNASEVDYRLNFSSGTAQQRLFGSSTSKGALGKLEEIVKRLEQQGYFERQSIRNQKPNVKPIKKSVLSDKTKLKIKELIKIIAEMPDYENYLTDSQKERIYQFLRLRSIKACAKYFNVTEITFKQSLLGKDDKSGILGRLKTAYDNKTVNSWEEL